MQAINELLNFASLLLSLSRTHCVKVQVGYILRLWYRFRLYFYGGSNRKCKGPYLPCMVGRNKDDIHAGSDWSRLGDGKGVLVVPRIQGRRPYRFSCEPSIGFRVRL